MRHRRRNRGARSTNADQAPLKRAWSRAPAQPHVEQNGPDAPSKVLIDGQPVIPSSAPFDIEQAEARPTPPPLPAPDPEPQPQPEPVPQPESVIQPPPVVQPEPFIHSEPAIAEVPEPAAGQRSAGPATALPEALPDPTPQPEPGPDPAPLPEPAMARAPAHAAVESAAGPELSEPAPSPDPTPEPSPDPTPEPKHAEAKEARRRSPSISTETEELLPAERPVTLGAAPGDRHGQPEGWGGQDHHHRQSRGGPGRDRTTGSWSSISIHRATPPPDWASTPGTSSCPCTTSSCGTRPSRTASSPPASRTSSWRRPPSTWPGSRSSWCRPSAGR